MVESSGDSYFIQKPLGTEYGRELGSENLDRDLAIVFEIVSEVDRGHPASADFPLNSIAVL
jgi:hypothetical protein